MHRHSVYKIFSFVVCIFILNSCNWINSREKRFLQKYGDENFEIFESWCLYIRGYSSDKRPVIFANRNYDVINGPLVIEWDNKSNRILHIGKQLIKEEYEFDSKNLAIIIARFMNLSISYLQVDSSKVYVGFEIGKGPSIMRITDVTSSKNVQVGPGNLGKGWKRIID